MLRILILKRLSIIASPELRCAILKDVLAKIPQTKDYDVSPLLEKIKTFTVEMIIDHAFYAAGMIQGMMSNISNE